MSDDAVTDGEQETVWHVLWRGVKGRCPKCGDGKLLRQYITQNEACSVCDEDLSGIRADDAPAWLTILVTGHFIVPFIHYFGTHQVFSPMVDIAIVVMVAMLFGAVILPRAKGLFIALMWWQSRDKETKG